MTKSPSRRVSVRIQIPGYDETVLHKAIGKAIDAYSLVEGAQAVLLEHLLKISPLQSWVVSKAIQNTRARGAMFGELINIRCEGQLDKHWAKCQNFLFRLADFRNAIVHWHMGMMYVRHPNFSDSRFALMAMPPNGTLPITELEIGPFIDDCEYIKAVLVELWVIIDGWPSTSIEASAIRPIRPNAAAIPKSRNPKASQPQRPPSKPSLLRKSGKKPSSAERRRHALGQKKIKL